MEVLLTKELHWFHNTTSTISGGQPFHPHSPDQYCYRANQSKMGFHPEWMVLRDLDDEVDDMYLMVGFHPEWTVLLRRRPKMSVHHSR